MRSFRLEKWYLDAVHVTGQALIAYSAKLSWGLVRLTYNGLTLRLSSSKIITQSSFVSRDFPSHEDKLVQWKFRSYQGKWVQAGARIEECLYDGEDGKIIWMCEHPKAMASVRIGSQSLDGNGYAEKIVITVPPWKIPIKELHWGRFLSENNTIVWIRWIGPIPKAILYFNGDRKLAASISCNEITFDNYILRIDNKRTLRSGTILSTVFSKFKMRNVFPKRIMTLEENKWLSDGTLSKHGEVEATGNVIHEVVIWP